VTFQAVALFMLSTVADMVPIAAPSADRGATLGCFCAHGEQTVKIAPKRVERIVSQRTSRLYSGKTQLRVAFFRQCVIIASVGAGAGRLAPQLEGADGKDWP